MVNAVLPVSQCEQSAVKMLRNRNVMSVLSSRFNRRSLPVCRVMLVTELAQLAGKISATQVVGQLHTAMTGGYPTNGMASGCAITSEPLLCVIWIAPRPRRLY